MNSKEQRVQMLDPNRMKIAKNNAYVPGGPMNNNPMNVTSNNPTPGFDEWRQSIPLRRFRSFGGRRPHGFTGDADAQVTAAAEHCRSVTGLQRRPALRPASSSPQQKWRRCWKADAFPLTPRTVSVEVTHPISWAMIRPAGHRCSWRCSAK